MAKTSIQSNLPPMMLTNRSQDVPVRTNCSQDDPDASAAAMFDAALSASGITSKEAAMLLGVSDSMVNRMRSPNHRERVSFAQMLRLPPAFHLSLHREMNKRFGFGRQALRDILDSLGTLATVGEL